MCTARPLPACGVVTLLRHNHQRKTRKTPRGQGLVGTQLFLISYYSLLSYAGINITSIRKQCFFPRFTYAEELCRHGCRKSVEYASLCNT